MTYVKQVWTDGVDSINAARMNHIEDGIGAAPSGGSLPVSVKDPPYGATGDGVTDDTVAIAAALTAGLGHEVVVPPGNYISGQLVVGAGTTLRLMPGATITRITGSVDPLLRVNAGGRVLGPGTLDCTLGTNAGIVVQGDDVVVRDLTIRNPAFGITGSNVQRALIERVSVVNSSNVGIFFQNISGADIDGPTVTGCRVDRSGQAASIANQGILVYGAPTNGLRQTKLTGNTVLMPMGATNANSICISFRRCPGIVVSGNSTIGGWMGTSVDTSVGAQVVANEFVGAVLYGIEIPSSSYVAVVGNTIDMTNAVSASATSQIGIAMDGTASSFVQIVGNSIRGLAALGTPQGIAATGNPQYLTISANYFELPNRTGALGINVVSGNFLTISNNTFKAAGASAFSPIQISNSTNVSITGNLVGTGFSRGVTAVGSSAFVLQSWTITGNYSPGAAFLVVSLSGGATIGNNFVVSGNTDGLDYLDYGRNVRRLAGTGSPETVVTAGVGSIFHRYDGGAGTCLYVKESGVGNTGWIAK